MSEESTTLDYGALLAEERASLEHQLAELGFGTPGETGLDYDSNFADSSQVSAERGETEALVGELRKQLHDVERAQQRLAEGTYGSCEKCGRAIAPARLEAMPAVTTCIEHASSAR
ncbi:MAG TPA: TraR/DksA C4-type zinc finger protein [Acidimicrobiales bacterium]|nr:TraR/DksA C4-type zinc finger protein [Acidimicrobiales bacterium]